MLKIAMPDKPLVWLHGEIRTPPFSKEARVEAGYVWINGCSNHFLATPFGGWKQSGIGREESLEELLSYTQSKNVNVNLNF